MLRGLFGMALAGFTKGKLAMAGEPKPTLDPRDYYKGKLSRAELDGMPGHDAVMDRWAGAHS